MVSMLFASTAHAQSEAEIAAAVTQRASAAYSAGDFERAAVLLEESIALHETSALHFNLARCYTELSRWLDAREHYQRFLELAPEAPQRASVEARIQELDRRIERETEPEPPPALNRVPEAHPEPDEPSPAALPARRPSPAPWVVLSASLLVAGAAIPVGFASNRVESDAARAENHRIGAERLDRATALSRTANGLAIGGAIIAVGALVWALARGRTRGASSASVDGQSVRISF